ncbi:MAG: AI-2E family transporter [Lactovum sp.]
MLKKNKLSSELLQLLIISAILVLLAFFIFLLTKISFLFVPIKTLISMVLIPFLIAGFLYYVFKPILYFMEEKFKMKKSLAIWLIFIISFLGISLILASFLPKIISQLTSLINSSISNLSEQQLWLDKIIKESDFQNFAKKIDLYKQLESLNISYTNILENILKGLTGSVGSIVTVIADFVMIIIMIPIFLYYMLMDAEKFVPFIRQSFLRHDRQNLLSLIEKINYLIGRYVTGTILDVTIIFFAALIVYMILGIPYAFLFSLIAAIFNLIPYVGPYVGVLPLILTTVWERPLVTAIAVVYVLVVQQIDANLIQPKIIGDAVQIHPLTVMVLMMVAGPLYGIIGMVIAVPLYAIVKEIVKFYAEIYWKKQERKLEKTTKLFASSLEE